MAVCDIAGLRVDIENMTGRTESRQSRIFPTIKISPT